MYTESELPTSTNPQVQDTSVHQHQANLSATAPGQLRVIKRNGTVVPFDASKIAIAMTKAFLAVEGGTAAASTRVRETVDNLTKQITATFKRRMPSGGTIHIEDIQDQVELTLMRAGEQKIARDYVLYREEHARLRAAKRAQDQAADPDYPSISVWISPACAPSWLKPAPVWPVWKKKPSSTKPCATSTTVWMKKT
jgi:ribonucleoside-diphosphate reductase alpha chain